MSVEGSYYALVIIIEEALGCRECNCWYCVKTWFSSPTFASLLSLSAYFGDSEDVFLESEFEMLS